MRLALLVLLYLGGCGCSPAWTERDAARAGSEARGAQFLLADCERDGGACLPGDVRAIAGMICANAAATLQAHGGDAGCP